MKKISAFIFILLISLSSLALFVEAAQRPRALPLPNNNRLMLPSAKPTVQIQLSHSPVLEDDDLEMTIRAKDDKGVKAISVAPSFSQPFIENCQVNGRSPRTCEKGFVFRMPAGQQRFIITAVDDENQNAVKTVMVNVLSFNENIDMQIIGPIAPPIQTEEDETIDLVFELLINGNARGNFCYETRDQFIPDDPNGSHPEDYHRQRCRGEYEVREGEEDPDYRNTFLSIEFPIYPFIEEPGRYIIEVEGWLEDENGRRIEEENEQNNRYRIEIPWNRRTPVSSCEEQVDGVLHNVGEQNEEVYGAIDRIADIDFQIWNTNPNEEELRELENQRRAALDQYGDKLQDARDEYEEAVEQMQECDFHYAPDLVITHVQQVTPDPILQGSDGIEYEVTIQNQGTATVYGPFDDQLWYDGRDSALSYSNRYRPHGDGFEPGETLTLWAGVGWRDIMNTPGNYPLFIGIDTGIQVCDNCDVDYQFGRYNRIPESNEENNVYTVNSEIVAQ